jgi:hypothetical protein
VRRAQFIIQRVLWVPLRPFAFRIYAHRLAVSLVILKRDLDDAVDKDAGGDDHLRVDLA